MAKLPRNIKKCTSSHYLFGHGLRSRVARPSLNMYRRKLACWEDFGGMEYLTYLLLCMSPIIIQLFEGKLLLEGKLLREAKFIVPCTHERMGYVLL